MRKLRVPKKNEKKFFDSHQDEKKVPKKMCEVFAS